MMLTSAGTTAPSDNLTRSPGTTPADATMAHVPSRRTDAFKARRDLSAVSVVCALPSWYRPTPALKTRRPAITPASVKSPSTTSSTMAASSIHGTGAQNFFSACTSGCTVVSASEFGPT